MTKWCPFFLQCDFQVVYASGINGKAGLSPDKLGDDLGPLFESIVRCIPGPHIDKDGALQMLVSVPCLIVFCFHFQYVNLLHSARNFMQTS